MAAVASSQMPEGLRGIDEQFTESGSSSRFTAVNGQGSPPATDRRTPVNGQEEKRNGAFSTNPEVEQVHEVITVQQPLTAATKPNQDQLLPPANDKPPLYPGSQPRSVSGSPPSRKRSYPEAFGDNHAAQVHRTHTEAPEYLRGPPGQYGHVARKPSIGHEIDPHRQQPPLSSDFDPHAQPRQPYYSHPPRDDSEARLAEALQRENGSVNRETFASPDTDEQHRQQYGEYGGRSALTDAERKRRKRVFSNRTKTGCMTCRKRKKKCDEQHPECKHVRTSFVTSLEDSLNRGAIHACLITSLTFCR